MKSSETRELLQHREVPTLALNKKIVIANVPK